MSSPAPDAAAGGAVPSVPSSVSGGLASMYSASELAALSLHTTAWRSEAWLHAYPLHRGTVLDYFKHTDFYDRTCNNEIVNMQQQGAEDTSKALRSDRQTHATTHSLLSCFSLFSFLFLSSFSLHPIAA
jgi:hypothetical protein